MMCIYIFPHNNHMARAYYYTPEPLFDIMKIVFSVPDPWVDGPTEVIEISDDVPTTNIVQPRPRGTTIASDSSDEVISPLLGNSHYTARRLFDELDSPPSFKVDQVDAHRSAGPSGSTRPRYPPRNFGCPSPSVNTNVSQPSSPTSQASDEHLAAPLSVLFQ